MQLAACSLLCWFFDFIFEPGNARMLEGREGLVDLNNHTTQENAFQGASSSSSNVTLHLYQLQN
jgi:hypothetical protein